MSGQPFSKEEQLARGERRYTRKIASPKRWQAIADAKMGPCRVCGATHAVELHHLAPRAIGGSDTEANIVPLCSLHHRAVTNRDKVACAKLRMALTDAEYAYAVDVLGEARFEDRYPVNWERAIGDFDSADRWQRYIAHQAAKGRWPVTCAYEDVDESAGLADEPWHGSIGGYTNHRCRCPECKEAWRVHRVSYRARHPERNAKTGRLEDERGL